MGEIMENEAIELSLTRGRRYEIFVKEDGKLDVRNVGDFERAGERPLSEEFPVGTRRTIIPLEIGHRFEISNYADGSFDLRDLG